MFELERVTENEKSYFGQIDIYVIYNMESRRMLHGFVQFISQNSVFLKKNIYGNSFGPI